MNFESTIHRSMKSQYQQEILGYQLRTRTLRDHSVTCDLVDNLTVQWIATANHDREISKKIFKNWLIRWWNLSFYLFHCLESSTDVPSNAPVCKVDDQTYKQGDSLELLRDFHGKQLGECHQCTCMAGKLEKCHRIYYCEKNKAGCNSHIKIPGQCCPACARGT